MNHRLQKPKPDALKKSTAKPAPKLGEIVGTVRWDSNVGQLNAGVGPAGAMDVIVTPSVGKVKVTGADINPEGGFEL